MAASLITGVVLPADGGWTAGKPELPFENGRFTEVGTSVHYVADCVLWYTGLLFSIGRLPWPARRIGAAPPHPTA